MLDFAERLDAAVAFIKAHAMTATGLALGFVLGAVLF